MSKQPAKLSSAARYLAFMASAGTDRSDFDRFFSGQPKRLTGDNKSSQPRLIQTYLTDNTDFKSPNQASHIAAGRAVNAWVVWRNSAGQATDKVIRGVIDE